MSVGKRVSRELGLHKTESSPHEDVESGGLWPYEPSGRDINVESEDAGCLSRLAVDGDCVPGKRRLDPELFVMRPSGRWKLVTHWAATPKRVQRPQGSVTCSLGGHRSFWFRHRSQADRLDVGKIDDWNVGFDMAHVYGLLCHKIGRYRYGDDS